MQKQLETKYAYDIGIWYAFYVHCHELEATFIPDESLRKCPDIHSPFYPGDITRRELTWNPESVFHATLYQDLKHQYADEKYQQYVKHNENEQNGRQKGVVFTMIGALSVMLIITAVCCIIYGVRHGLMHSWIFGAILLTVSWGVNFGGFIWFMRHKQVMVTRNGKDKMVNKVLSFNDWFDQNIKETEDWVSHYYDAFSRYKKKVEEGLESKERQEDLATLTQARKYLTSMIDLPEEYTDEYHIRSLFDLYLIGNVQSLEKGIELMEDETLMEEMKNRPSDREFVEERFTYRIEHNRESQSQELLKSLEPNRFIYKYMNDNLHLKPYPISFEDIQ